MEIWKDIEGYEGLYQVSNLGNVKSLNYKHTGKERVLKTAKDKDNYLVVGLYKEAKLKTHRVHRLVAQSFIPNSKNLPQINHKDEDKTNNCVENLEFCDRKYNCNFGTRNQRVAESNSKRVLCVENGVVYSSTMEVQRQLGFSNGNISSACNGKLKTAYGFHWCYIA